MERAQRVTASDPCGGEVEKYACPRLGFGFCQPNHLFVNEAEVTLQVELVRASDDVVLTAIDEPVNRVPRCWCVIPDCLTQFERRAQQREVKVRLDRGEQVVHRDGVCVLIDIGGLEGFGVERRVTQDSQILG